MKADVRRDYYADLGLAPSADAEDIKKQFRKLGERALFALQAYADRSSAQVPP